MSNIICNECETVAHCMKNGCIPKQLVVVPDFLTAHDPETPEYRNGWNDCRQLMMEMFRRENT